MSSWIRSGSCQVLLDQPVGCWFAMLFVGGIVIGQLTDALLWKGFPLSTVTEVFDYRLMELDNLDLCSALLHTTISFLGGDESHAEPCNGS